MTRRLVITPLVALLALGAGFALGWLAHQPQETTTPPSTSALRVMFAGRTIEGGHLGPADYLGRVAVFNVWATWCVPCRATLPVLRDVQAVTPSSVVFIGVNYDDDVAHARSLATQLGVRFPSIELDRSSDALKRAGVTGLPTTFIVGRDAQVVATLRGIPTVADIEAAIQKATTTLGPRGSAVGSIAPSAAEDS